MERNLEEIKEFITNSFVDIKESNKLLNKNIKYKEIELSNLLKINITEKSDTENVIGIIDGIMSLREIYLIHKKVKEYYGLGNEKVYIIERREKNKSSKVILIEYIERKNYKNYKKEEVI